MSADASHLYDAALNLPDRERADLAFHLLRSLPPSVVPNENDPAFTEELERRVAEYEAGKTTASDWNDVAARLRNTLSERQLSRKRQSQ